MFPILALLMNALRIFQCLRNPIFARLYIAQTTSLLEDALTWVGLALLYGSIIGLVLLVVVQLTFSPNANEYEHEHENIWHEHEHIHDEHHQHQHEEGVIVGEYHIHPHQHKSMRHSHRYSVDLHHPAR